MTIERPKPVVETVPDTDENWLQRQVRLAREDMETWPQWMKDVCRMCGER